VNWLPASIFFAAAIIIFGFGSAVVFEGFSVLLRKPTISSLSANAIVAHPHIALLSALGIGILIGALTTHFTNWRP
jgi:hypothetical protein